MPTPAITPEALFGEVRKNWGWLLALGLVSLVLGFVGRGYCLALTLIGVEVFGWLLLIAGVVEIFQVFKCRGWKSIGWQLIISAVHIVAGIVVVMDPLLASSFFTLFLAAAIFVAGAARIWVALHHRDHKGWGWMLFGGAVAVGLGAMIAVEWPGSSFFVIGMFIAIELVFNGWAMVLLALAARSGSGPGTPADQPA
jgi:uncharacterized membrane protein HdeD (DUF308 family)